MPKFHGVVVRRLRLRPQHLPVPIFQLDEDAEPRPIDPDWLCIVRWSNRSADPRHDVYELAFYRDDGQWLEGLQYDTLEIALDQAQGLVGVHPGEWDEVQLSVPDRSGESRLSDWTPVDAFPTALRSDIDDPRFLRCLPESRLRPAGQFTVKVQDEHVHIPYRIYNPPPTRRDVSDLSPRQQRMIHCLYTRHHDGFVRQSNLERVIQADDPWVVPFVMRLLGEYVIEIIEIIADDISDTPLVRGHHVEFCRENPEFVRRTMARATSYWNCYYRKQYPDRADYPGVITLRRLCAPHSVQTDSS